MKKICFFFFLLFSLQSFSQKVVLKNNLVYDALLTPNLSVEFSLGKKWTLDTQIGMNFFFYENDATANGYKTKKWSHWLVQPEIRYWTCETFNGWFLGLHAHGGQMNVGGINIPFIIQNHSKENDLYLISSLRQSNLIKLFCQIYILIMIKPYYIYHVNLFHFHQQQTVPIYESN